MKKVLVLSFGAAAILASCAKDNSANVNQDSIYTIYELFYDADTDKTTARATFKFGGATGTLLELDAPAGATFNGTDLLWNQALGIHRADWVGLTDNGTFVYNDLDDNTFTNAIGTIDPIGFPITVDTISMSSAFNFVWTGNAVGANETITLTINGQTGGNIEIFTTILEAGTDLTLSMDKLNNLGIGDATCYLKRAYNNSTVAEGTSEGGRVAVWYILSKTIYIKA
ncbi:hypothetical protein JYT74_00145 [Crocinitomix catalasitica]|nr:hypothetical protein [Crocinitomix catalasitica]